MIPITCQESARLRPNQGEKSPGNVISPPSGLSSSALQRVPGSSWRAANCPLTLVEALYTPGSQLRHWEHRRTPRAYPAATGEQRSNTPSLDAGTEQRWCWATKESASEVSADTPDKSDSFRLWLRQADLLPHPITNHLPCRPCPTNSRAQSPPNRQRTHSKGARCAVAR